MAPKSWQEETNRFGCMSAAGPKLGTLALRMSKTCGPTSVAGENPTKHHPQKRNRHQGDAVSYFAQADDELNY